MTVDRGALTDQLLTDLALPADTPVVEWQRSAAEWTTPETPGEPITTVYPVQLIDAGPLYEREALPAGTSTRTLTVPAAAQPGDTLVLVVGWRSDSVTHEPTVSPGTWWSETDVDQPAARPSTTWYQHLRVLTHTLAAGETQVTVSVPMTASGRDWHQLFVLRDAGDIRHWRFTQADATATTAEWASHNVTELGGTIPVTSGGLMLQAATCAYADSTINTADLAWRTSGATAALSAPVNRGGANQPSRLTTWTRSITADNDNEPHPTIEHRSVTPQDPGVSKPHSYVSWVMAFSPRTETITPDPTPGDPTLVTSWVTDAARSAALSGYSVTYGRQSPTDKVGPLQASVQLVRPLAGVDLPTVGERLRLTISEPVAAALGLAEEDRPRFTGEITDVDTDTEGNVSVIGVGKRSRLDQVPLEAAPLPEQLDGERAWSVLTAVSILMPDIEIGTIDTGTALMRKLLAPAGSAQQQLEAITTAGASQVVEQRTGAIDYQDRDHRRGAVSRMTLDGATELIKPFRWSQSIAGLINDATVTYGAAQRSVRVTDSHSADLATGYGLHSTQVTTDLADAGEAYALASDLVGRYAQPFWRLPVVTVDLIRTARAKLATLLALRHGDLIDLVNLPADGPYTAPPRGVFVEGTTETMTRTAWRLSLSVADPALAGVSMRWTDVPAAETWETTNPELRWLDVAGADPGDL